MDDMPEIPDISEEGTVFSYYAFYKGVLLEVGQSDDQEFNKQVDSLSEGDYVTYVDKLGEEYNCKVIEKNFKNGAYYILVE